MLRVVEVEVLGLVIQRVEEQVCNRAGVRALTGAVHVARDAVGPEALRVIIPTAGLRCVHQRQGLSEAVGRKPFLVEVNSDVRNQRLPLRLNEHHGIVKRAGRCVDDMALDAAIFTGDVRLLAKFEEAVLAREALPALHSSGPGIIDAA